MKPAPGEAGSSSTSPSEVAATAPSPSRANRVIVDPDAELADGIEENTEEGSTAITEQMKAEEEK